MRQLCAVNFHQCAIGGNSDTAVGLIPVLVTMSVRETPTAGQDDFRRTANEQENGQDNDASSFHLNA